MSAPGGGGRGQRTFIWRLPYKPPQASTRSSQSEAASSAGRTSTAPVSPKSHPQAGTDQSQLTAADFLRPICPEVTYQFPGKSYLPSELSSASASSSSNRINATMSDPNSISEVSGDNFLKMLRGPGAGSASLPSFLIPYDTQTEKNKIVSSLRNHSVNTLAELRRIERILAAIGTPDVTEPMTSAWTYYVNSHMLLTELRSLTRNYPFSSDCLDEAKRRVLNDPTSNRSWNYCWLVLTKVQSDNLIPYYAQYQASLPAMWGNTNPTAEGIQALTAAFTNEWAWAIDQMIRHWETPPVGSSSGSGSST